MAMENNERIQRIENSWRVEVFWLREATLGQLDLICHPQNIFKNSEKAQ